MAQLATNHEQAGWRASLELEYERRLAKTCLVKKQHCGPLMVQKPFYPEAEQCCHTYLIHPPGGIAGGDQLYINAQINDNSHVLITTPAATKFYRSIGPQALQQQILNVSSNAILEWLPQETVYFSEANVVNKTIFHIHPTTSLFAWEIQCLGLTAQQQDFELGSCIQRLEVWQQNKPLILETNRFIGGDQQLQSACGMNGYKALATFIIKDPKQCLDNSIIMAVKSNYHSIVTASTYVHGFFIIRALAEYAEEIKNYFTQVWHYARPLMIAQDACPPRIWKT